jgi:hypothetical protein
MRKRWSHVLAGVFTGGYRWEFLFYDRETGDAEIHTVAPGSGALIRVATDAAWPGDWTQAVSFWSANGGSDVLAYDRLLDRAGTFGRLDDSASPKFGPRATLDFGRARQAQTFTGHYYAAESQDSNVVLHQGLTAAAAAWATGGHEAWTLLSKDAGTAAWQAATADDGARHVFEDAGLPGPPDPSAIVPQLELVSPDLVDTIRLGPALTNAILTGGGVDDLRLLVDTLRDHDLSSALAFTTVIEGVGSVVLTLGVTGLPGAGLNLSERRAAGFRWYAVPLSGFRGEIAAAGPTATFTPADEGLTALVLLAYARGSGLADPYQFTIDLPDGAALNLTQYEFLMNLLDFAHPAGIGINTYSVRKQHVKIDGAVAPLPPGISRTYRPFRRPRGRGSSVRALGVATPAVQAGWRSAGGVIRDGLAVVPNLDGRIAVFTTTTDGSVQTISQVSAGGDLGGWTSLGGILTGSVTAAVNADGRLDVFGRGTDGSLYHTTQDEPGGAFSGGWNTLGGLIGEPIVVGRNLDGRLEAFAPGLDHNVWHTWQTAPGGPWLGWDSLQGPVDGLMVVSANQDGRLVVAVRRTDGTLWKVEQADPNGKWGDWSALGGTAANVLDVGLRRDGCLELFAGSPDTDLLHSSQVGPNSADWSEWSSLQGDVGTALAVAQARSGALEIAAARTDNSVEVASATGPGDFGPWSPLGGTASRYAALAANTDGRLELFVRGNDNALWHVAQGDDGWNG